MVVGDLWGSGVATQAFMKRRISITQLMRGVGTPEKGISWKHHTFTGFGQLVA